MRACVRTGSLTLAFALLASSSAMADADVEEGFRLAQEAAFEEALAAFDRAEQGDLTRPELIRLLEGRALVHQGTGDGAARDRALSALASMAPEHRMGRELPPQLVTAFEAVRDRTAGGIRVTVTASAIPDGVHLSARAEGDVTGLVREVRVSTRRDGGAFSTTGGAEVSVPVPTGGSVEYHAVALGPGGAPVATSGSAEAPLSWSATVTPASAERGGESPAGVGAGGAAPLSPGGGTGVADDDEGGPGVWPWIIGAGVLAAAVTVALVLLLPSSDTVPNVPTHSL